MQISLPAQTSTNKLEKQAMEKTTLIEVLVCLNLFSRHMHSVVISSKLVLRKGLLLE